EANLTCNDPTDTIQNLFYQDFETGTSGFTFGAISGTFQWERIPDYVFGGEYALWGDDEVSSNSYARFTGGVSLTGSTEYYLYFKHAYGFEDPAFDGGIIEYSTNGGSTWTNASGLPVTGRNYGGVFSASGSNGFINDSHGFVSTRYNLSSKA